MRTSVNIIRMPVVLLIIASLFPFFANAQKSKPEKGKVEIIQDPRIDILVSKQIQINQKQDGLEGFRIQLFSESGNNAKAQAQSVQDGFRARYPEVEAYLTYKSPNYRVRVGNFRTRLDAQYFVNEISANYQNAFIIGEHIQLPKD